MAEYAAAEVTLTTAVEQALAQDPRTLRARLIRAWVSLGVLFDGTAAMPPDLAGELAEVAVQIAATGRSGGRLLAWVNSLTDSQCQEEARRIVRWLHTVRQHNLSQTTPGGPALATS